MRWVHDLRAFDAQPIADQERVFGRSKWDSVEMEPNVKPPTAHIARVEISDDEGDELPIYRRSVPYGTVEEAGLYFVAFSADRARLDRMLGRMFGLEADGLHDHLLDFSRPVSGAVYFAPALHLLAEDADRPATGALTSEPAAEAPGTLLRLAAFTADPRGGNPAGVWIGDALLPPDQMRRIAADVGYSETAFLAPDGSGLPGRFRVRYFSPLAEVPFCGHATIASGVALSDRGLAAEPGGGRDRWVPTDRSRDERRTGRDRHGGRGAWPHASDSHVGRDLGPRARAALTAAALELLGWRRMSSI